MLSFFEKSISPRYIPMMLSFVGILGGKAVQLIVRIGTDTAVGSNPQDDFLLRLRCRYINLFSCQVIPCRCHSFTSSY